MVNMSKKPSKSLATELDPFIAPFRVDGSRQFHLTAHKTSTKGGLPGPLREQLRVPTAAHRRFRRVVVVTAPWIFAAAALAPE